MLFLIQLYKLHQIPYKQIKSTTINITDQFFIQMRSIAQKYKNFLKFILIIYSVFKTMTKIIQDYKLFEVIGEGSYAKVYRAVNTLDNQQYAIKVIESKKLKQDKKLLQYTKNEVNILSKIQKNPHIIRYYQMIQSPNNLYLVYQYCNGGTLAQLLQRKKKLRQSQALIILKQLLEAFKILHRNHVMHRDLKPENIFFQNEIIKLGDFGFCKNVGKTSVTRSILGSPVYMAPEVLKGLNYSNKADIWSIGVVFYQTLYGYCPFQSSSINKLIQMIQSNQLCFPDTVQISQSIKCLLKKLLTKEVKNRIDWQQLFELKISETGEYIQMSEKSINRMQYSVSLHNTQELKIHKNTHRGQVLNRDLQKIKRQIILARQHSPILLKRKTNIDKDNQEAQGSIFRMKKIKSTMQETDDQSLKTKFFRKQSTTSNRKDTTSKKTNESFNDVPIVYVRPNSPVWKMTDINKQVAVTEHNAIIHGLKIARVFSTATVRYSNLFSQILYCEVQQRLTQLKNKLKGKNQLPQLINLIDSQLQQIQHQSQKLRCANEVNTSLVQANKSNLVFLVKDKVKQSKDIKLCYQLSCYLMKHTAQKINPLQMKQVIQQLFQ